MIQAVKDNVSWRAIPLAGLAGGTAFLLVVLALSSPWLGVEPRLMLYYFAALALGTDALVDQSAGVVLAGLGVHYGLSVIFAYLVAVVVHRWGLVVGIVGGALLGLSLYAINLYTLTVWFPWFFAVNSTLLALAHLVYGAVVGGVYEMFDHFDVGSQPEVTA